MYIIKAHYKFQCTYRVYVPLTSSALVFCVKMHKLLWELPLLFGPSSSNQVHCLIFVDSVHITDRHLINIAKSILAGFTSNFAMWFSV